MSLQHIVKKNIPVQEGILAIGTGAFAVLLALGAISYKIDTKQRRK